MKFGSAFIPPLFLSVCLSTTLPPPPSSPSSPLTPPLPQPLIDILDPPDPSSLSSQNLVLALYTYTAASSDELTFHKGSVITVLSKKGDWWKGELNGTVGLFPSNYVQPLNETTTAGEATRCKLPPATLIRNSWMNLTH